MNLYEGFFECVNQLNGNMNEVMGLYPYERDMFLQRSIQKTKKESSDLEAYIQAIENK